MFCLITLGASEASGVCNFWHLSAKILYAVEPKTATSPCVHFELAASPSEKNTSLLYVSIFSRFEIVEIISSNIFFTFMSDGIKKEHLVSFSKDKLASDKNLSNKLTGQSCDSASLEMGTILPSRCWSHLDVSRKFSIWVGSIFISPNVTLNNSSILKKPKKPSEQIKRNLISIRLSELKVKKSNVLVFLVSSVP